MIKERGKEMIKERRRDDKGQGGEEIIKEMGERR